MEVSYVTSELREFGEAEAVRSEGGFIVFHLQVELSSLMEIENLIERLSNLHAEDVKLTGEDGLSLLIIRIDMDRFSQIPPYLYDNWVDTDYE